MSEFKLFDRIRLKQELRAQWCFTELLSVEEASSPKIDSIVDDVINKVLEVLSMKGIILDQGNPAEISYGEYDKWLGRLGTGSLIFIPNMLIGKGR